MILTTTFALLRKAGACTSRYKFLRESLPDVADDEPINMLTILDINGLDDALWALRATAENCDMVARLMAADFAEEALPIWQKYYPDDKRPALAIQAARDFAHGRITAEQLAEAAAAWAAPGAAAWAAARAAARDAAWAAARDAADAAAGAAAVKKQREIFTSYLRMEVKP